MQANAIHGHGWSGPEVGGVFSGEAPTKLAQALSGTTQAVTSSPASECSRRLMFCLPPTRPYATPWMVVSGQEFGTSPRCPSLTSGRAYQLQCRVTACVITAHTCDTHACTVGLAARTNISAQSTNTHTQAPQALCHTYCPPGPKAG